MPFLKKVNENQRPYLFNQKFLFCKHCNKEMRQRFRQRCRLKNHLNIKNKTLFRFNISNAKYLSFALCISNAKYVFSK